MSTGKNRYYLRSRIAEARFRRLARAFAMNLTATDAAEQRDIAELPFRSISAKDAYMPVKLFFEAQFNSCSPAAL